MKRVICKYMAQKLKYTNNTFYSISIHSHQFHTNRFLIHSSYPSASIPLQSPSSSASSASASTSNNTNTTDFGFRNVNIDEKQGLVHDVFARVAKSYDIMNDAMSIGMHRLWKYHLVEKIKPHKNIKHLDVAGGTGDIAFRVLMAAHRDNLPPAYTVTPISTSNIDVKNRDENNYLQSAQVIVCDINANMLQVGIERARQQYGYEPGALIVPAPLPNNENTNPTASAATTSPSSSSSSTTTTTTTTIGVEQLSASRMYASRGPICFVEGNAELLPFESDTFDSYTIVFGLRNVTHRDLALKEAYRVLKPGGRFLCMEFSHVNIPIFNQIYSTYSQQIIPFMGQIIANDRDSYQYLVESIARFPNQQQLLRMIKNAGFICVNYENLTGGIVAIHEGFKPL